jgi:hypothetical protein
MLDYLPPSTIIPTPGIIPALIPYPPGAFVGRMISDAKIEGGQEAEGNGRNHSGQKELISSGYRRFLVL